MDVIPHGGRGGRAAGECGPVRSLLDQPPVPVRRGEHPRRDAQLGSHDAAVVTAAVESLGCWAATLAAPASSGTRDSTCSVCHGCSSTCARSVVEGLRLVPDPAGHPDPAQVVEVPGHPRACGSPDGQTELPPAPAASVGDGGRVPLEPRTLQVGQVAERAAPRARRPRPPRAGPGPAPSHHVVYASRSARSSSTSRREQLDQSWVELRPGSSLHLQPGRASGPATRVNVVAHRRDVHHPARPRDLSRPTAGWPTVPHRRHVPRQSWTESGSPSLRARRTGHLARGDRTLGIEPTARHEGGRHRAHAGAATALRHQTRKRAHLVTGVGRVGEEAARTAAMSSPKTRGELVGVGRAAEVLQQRAVQRVPPRLGRAAQRIRQPAGDDAASQRLLERRASAHVHGHRQPAEQTDEAEHVPTVHPEWPIRHPFRRGRERSGVATTARRTRSRCRPGPGWRRRRAGRGRRRRWRCRRPRPG